MQGPISSGLYLVIAKLEHLVLYIADLNKEVRDECKDGPVLQRHFDLLSADKCLVFRSSSSFQVVLSRKLANLSDFVGVQISDISAVELWISRARIVDRATVRVGELPCVLSCFALGQFGTNVHSRNGNRQHDTIDVDRLVLGQRPV